MPAQQLDFFKARRKRGKKSSRPSGVFGGLYLRNYHPSCKRPLDSKKALHIVLKSSRAVGVRSFKSARYEAKIWRLIKTHADRLGVRIYEYANSGNHLHLLVRCGSRVSYNHWIRVVTGLIARLVGGAERGRKLEGKFWDYRPFTRIVSFGTKAFQVAKSYLLKNTLETIGFIPYTPRKHRLPPALRRQERGAVSTGSD